MCENYGFRWGVLRICGPAIPVLLAVIFCMPATGRTITIDNDGPADFTIIQAETDAENDGDVVIVQAETSTTLFEWISKA